MRLNMWHNALYTKAKLASKHPCVNAILTAFLIRSSKGPRPNIMPMTNACANRSFDPYLKPYVAPFKDDLMQLI